MRRSRARPPGRCPCRPSASTWTGTPAHKGWTDRDETRWLVPFWHIDTGTATLLIVLTPVDEAIAIGHDAETGRASLASLRRPLAEVIHYGKW